MAKKIPNTIIKDFVKLGIAKDLTNLNGTRAEKGLSLFAVSEGATGVTGALFYNSKTKKLYAAPTRSAVLRWM